MTFPAMISHPSVRQILLIEAAAAALLLAAALIAQYGFGLYPCELCTYQRYPYVAILALALFAFLLVKSPRLQFFLALACGLLFALDAGVAFYHAGVEWGIFTGPDACASAGGTGQTLEEMRQALLNAPLVPCNQAMAHIFGLSLAAWNALAAATLTLWTLASLWRLRKSA